jgi:hypothetical protein
MLLARTEYAILLYIEIALSRTSFGMRHTFLLGMTDTVTSPNIILSTGVFVY